MMNKRVGLKFISVIGMLFVFFGVPKEGKAQAIGDYRTFQTGNWSDVNSWSRWNGTSWVNPAPSAPASTAGVITILNGHTITVTSAATVDQVTINAGGQVTVNGGITLTVANGSGTDLTVNGTFTVTGTVTGPQAITIGNGGIATVTGTMNLTTGNPTLTVSAGGNLNIAGGSVSLASVSTLSLSGTITMSGASTLAVARGNGGSLITVNSGGLLSMSDTAQITATGVATITGVTVNSGGTLTMGPSTIIGGSGLFTLNSGASMSIGSTAGITSSGATGNIQVASTRTFSTGANYTYAGTAAQNTGNGLPATVNNLTINNTAGDVTLGAAATVNGILTLISGNLAVTDPNVLTMGASATTTGATDVTGIVKRTTLVAATSYTFGNQFTTLTFQNIGTLPTDVSIKISIGSAPAWKMSAVQRTYDVIRTGGSGSLAAMNLHYLDAELNGNTENKLVHWDAQLPSPPGAMTEHGRVNYNTTDNWVGCSNMDVSYFPTAFGSIVWTLADSALSSFTWNGSNSTVWSSAANWTPVGNPSEFNDVIIPNWLPS